MTWAGKYTSVMTVVAADICVIHIEDERLVSARIWFVSWEIGKERNAIGCHWLVICFYETFCISMTYLGNFVSVLHK